MPTPGDIPRICLQYWLSQRKQIESIKLRCQEISANFLPINRPKENSFLFFEGSAEFISMRRLWHLRNNRFCTCLCQFIVRLFKTKDIIWKWGMENPFVYIYILFEFCTCLCQSTVRLFKTKDIIWKWGTKNPFVYISTLFEAFIGQFNLKFETTECGDGDQSVQTFKLHDIEI